MDSFKNESVNDDNEVSINDILAGYRKVKLHIKNRWKFICVCTVLAASLVFAYSLFIKTNYTAICTFVLDDNESPGMLGQYAGLASLAGIDISGGGGIFKGDNILQLYKSRSMIEKALLSEFQFNGRKQRLIDRYISYNGLLKKWKNHDNIEYIDFNGGPDKFSRIQDSIITDIAKTFNKKNLYIEKPDKKLSVIKVSFSSKDELFAKEFTDKLVDNVNSFYIQTKTKKTAQNVLILQRQADSVKTALNSSLYGAAAAVDAAPNANPALLSLRVPSQKKQVDVQASTAIYAEIVKNLEIAKISLRQQTPLIQFIDKPILPLDNNHIKTIPGLLIGAFIGLFLSLCYLIVQGIWKLVTDK